jgi:hypothetical protein
LVLRIGLDDVQEELNLTLSSFRFD